MVKEQISSTVFTDLYIMNTKKAIPKNNNGSHPDILSLFNAKSFLNIN